MNDDNYGCEIWFGPLLIVAILFLFWFIDSHGAEVDAAISRWPAAPTGSVCK